MYPHFSSNHPQHRHQQDWDNTIQHTVKDQRRLQLYTQTVYFATYYTRLPRQTYYRKLFPMATLLQSQKTTTYQQTHRYNNKPTIYYRSKYNKHARTDKIVRHILHKYPNMHIPKLTKAYCNTTKLHTMLTNSYTQKLSNLNNFSTRQPVYTLFYTCHTPISIIYWYLYDQNKYIDTCRVTFKITCIQVICQNRGRVLHHGFQTPRNRWKHEARRPSAFICFEVFGTRDEARSPSFWHVFSNETIRNYVVTCFLKSNNDKLCSVTFCPSPKKHVYMHDELLFV